jgi:NADH-quinone oxidoreductase subunit L
MAGPTPVSALIHAATMVTAGIYMIARTSPLFELAPASANLVALVGAATALFAASIAVGQFDIKRVLAYSTISQLGFMISAVGIGAYAAGMFHLITHAFFKALLFLSAGSVIQGVERGHQHAAHGQHESHGEPFDPNDMRGMGGLRGRMPVTFIVYLVGSLALAGIPPLAGFFSKDEILADAAAGHTAIYLLLTAAAFLTAFYIGRQVLMVFFGKPRSGAAEQAEESPAVMTGPLIALAGLAAVGGALNFPGLHSLTLFLEHTLEGLHASEFNPAVAGISTGLGLVALLFAWLLYGRKTLAAGEADPLTRMLGLLFTALNRKWYVDELYDWLFVRRYVAAAGWLANTLDGRFWHDWFHDTLLARSFRLGTRWLNESFDLPVIDGAFNGLAHLTQRAANRLRTLQTGYVRNYAISVFVGLLLVMSYLLFR